ncbi:MAG TPA: 3'-5' exonuclease, partial [Acidobacteriota bacterium]|nr:3'-5' exonuclease [Acidobacteriota bacterium]
QGTRGIAILYRTNFQSRQFEEALRRLSIKYRLVGGLSFYQRKEIKDAIAFLRVARNPDDEVSLTRIINEPPRGIGSTTIGSVFELSRSRGITLWQAILTGLEENYFPARSHLALQRFVELVKGWQKALQKPLHMALDTVLQESGYISALREEDSEEADSRLLNLQELTTVAGDYEDENDPLQSFLDHAALRSDIDDYDAQAPVTLMTLHNAKGLEFPIVYLAGLEEGLFPHSRSIEEDDLEEERRLCYVGLTRAQRQLHLSYSRRRRFFGRQGNELNKPSRFLSEIPAELLEVAGLHRGFERSYTTPSFLSSAPPNRPSRPYEGKTYNSVESVKNFLEERGQAKGVKGIVAGGLIVHEKFGTGKVLSVEPKSDGDIKITVQFPGKGIKKMLQRYANLKPL